MAESGHPLRPAAVRKLARNDDPLGRTVQTEKYLRKASSANANEWRFPRFGGGEWFLMWQSKMWNGQEEAFRMFTIVGVVFLVVVQREPTPD